MKVMRVCGNSVAMMLMVAYLLLGSLQMQAQNRAEWEKLKGDVTLYMTNDMGRNGYYDQKPIAELMGEMAGVVDPECVLAVGDIHHFNGVASLQDPLWMTNYELIYSHPDLMLDWFPVCGNHEYRGKTQAFMDYGKVSRRWMMPSKYYTKVFNHGNTTIRIVFLDTTPLIDSYRENSAVYPDAFMFSRLSFGILIFFSSLEYTLVPHFGQNLSSLSNSSPHLVQNTYYSSLLCFYISFRV